MSQNINVNTYLEEIQRREKRRINNFRSTNFKRDKPTNMQFEMLDPDNIPEDRIYGDVEYYNSVEGYKMENLEFHLDNGWEYVDRMNHPEIPAPSRITRDYFLSDREGVEARGKTSHLKFDPDDQWIKRNGLIKMSKDKFLHEEYERGIHTIPTEQAKLASEEGFNNSAQAYDMKMKKSYDDQPDVETGEFRAYI